MKQDRYGPDRRDLDEITQGQVLECRLPNTTPSPVIGIEFSPLYLGEIQ